MGQVRYIIIGAGAVGGTIGGCLFQGGHDVVLVARGAHLAALRAGGLRLETPAGTHTLDIPAVGGPAELELRPGDVLIMATKSQDSAALLGEWSVRPVAGGTVAARDLPVVCAQNGVANEAMALRRFRQVYGMCVWLPASHLEPGTVQAQGTPMAGLLVTGRYPGGTDETAERIAAALATSRFVAPPSPDVMRWKYCKLLSNLGNAIEALCGREATGLDGAPPAEAAELLSRTRAEGTAALDAAGIGYASMTEVTGVLGYGRHVRIEPVNGSARSGGSSWQSLIRGTGSIEADFLNGEIARLGRLHGVPTPVNATLQWLANRAAAEHRPPGSMTPGAVLAMAG